MSKEIVEQVNRNLLENYGRFDTTDKPVWRVVWSEDQLEKRWMTHTREGFPLLQPEVREVPKYRQWIQEKYVLERIVAIPEFVENELVEQISYEPVWVFEDKAGKPLPPIWSAVHLIVEQVYKQAAKATGVKYKDPEIIDPKMTKEDQLERIDNLVKEMFGDETDTGDALAYKEGVVVPQNYEKTEEKTNGSL
jgi:hypothetical protein